MFFSSQMDFRKRDLSESGITRSNSFKKTLMHMKSNFLSSDSKKTYSDNTVRVAFLGGSKVGKTSIISQFLFDRFPATQNYIETIEDLYKHRYTEENGEIAMDIFDTSGSRDYDSFRYRVIKKCDGFVILYSVEDRESYREMRVLREQVVTEKKSKKVPIVIVGNKSDCQEKSFLRREAIDSVVSKWGHDHVLCSAKSPADVTCIFDTLKVALRKSEVPKDNRENRCMDGNLWIKAIGRNDKILWIKIR